MKELTKAEEQVMQILWKCQKAFVRELLEYFDEPKPAYNTVSTIIRILEKKGFVSHESIGKMHRYFPLVSKDNYKKKFFKGFMKNYFSNSFNQLVSFFSKSEDLTIEQMEEMRKMLDEEINNKKNRQND